MVNTQDQDLQRKLMDQYGLTGRVMPYVYRQRAGTMEFPFTTSSDNCRFWVVSETDPDEEESEIYIVVQFPHMGKLRLIRVPVTGNRLGSDETLLTPEQYALVKVLAREPLGPTGLAAVDRDISGTVEMMAALDEDSPEFNEETKKAEVVIRDALLRLFISKEFHDGPQSHLDRLANSEDLLLWLSEWSIRFILESVFETTQGQALQVYDPKLRELVEQSLLL